MTPVLTPDEALMHPQFVARGMVVYTVQGRHLAPPLKLDGWGLSVERGAPAAGEHSAEVLAEAGFTAEEIAALRRAAVI